MKINSLYESNFNRATSEEEGLRNNVNNEFVDYDEFDIFHFAKRALLMSNRKNAVYSILSRFIYDSYWLETTYKNLLSSTLQSFFEAIFGVVVVVVFSVGRVECYRIIMNNNHRNRRHTQIERNSDREIESERTERRTTAKLHPYKVQKSVA